MTLTLKVYDGVYAHKDIVEGGKEHKDITSLLRIGKILKIGEDTFEDLDEVSSSMSANMLSNQRFSVASFSVIPFCLLNWDKPIVSNRLLYLT